MKTLKCSNCKISFEIDEKNACTTSEYIECPYCRFNCQLNPFYKGENKKINKTENQV